MKRKASLLSFHIVINPELWVFFNYRSDGIFIFSISFWFIIIALTKVNDNDIRIINDNIEMVNVGTYNKTNNNLSIYAPGKVKIVCVECGREDSIYENEKFTCPGCQNSDPSKIIVYTNPKK